MTLQEEEDKLILLQLQIVQQSLFLTNGQSVRNIGLVTILWWLEMVSKMTFLHTYFLCKFNYLVCVQLCGGKLRYDDAQPITKVSAFICI